MNALVVAFVLVGIVAVACGVGWLLAMDCHHAERRTLEAHAEALQAQWHHLQQTQQLNAAFWDARAALRSEALQHQAQTHRGY